MSVRKQHHHSIGELLQQLKRNSMKLESAKFEGEAIPKVEELCEECEKLFLLERSSDSVIQNSELPVDKKKEELKVTEHEMPKENKLDLDSALQEIQSKAVAQLLSRHDFTFTPEVICKSLNDFPNHSYNKTMLSAFMNGMLRGSFLPKWEKLNFFLRNFNYLAAKKYLASAIVHIQLRLMDRRIALGQEYSSEDLTNYLVQIRKRVSCTVDYQIDKAMIVIIAFLAEPPLEPPYFVKSPEVKNIKKWINLRKAHAEMIESDNESEDMDDHVTSLFKEKTTSLYVSEDFELYLVTRLLLAGKRELSSEESED